MQYKKIRLPDGKRVYEHRKVAEEKIGRVLLKTEVVHHLNGDILSNEPENLFVCLSPGKHIAQFHPAPTRKIRLNCKQCGREFLRWPSRERKFCSPICYWKWKPRQIFKRRTNGTFMSKS